MVNALAVVMMRACHSHFTQILQAAVDFSPLQRILADQIYAETTRDECGNGLASDVPLHNNTSQKLRVLSQNLWALPVSQRNVNCFSRDFFPSQVVADKLERRVLQMIAELHKWDVVCFQVPPLLSCSCSIRYLVADC